MPALAAAFKKIAQRAFVGVKTHTHILDVEDNRVEVCENGVRGAALRVAVPVHAVDGNTGGRILESSTLRVSTIPAMPCSGLKIAAQLDAGRMGQHIDRPPPVRIHAGLVGHQSHPHRMSRVGLQLAKVVRLKHVDSSLHFAVARREPPRRHQRFVVSGDARQPQLLSFRDCQIKRLHHGSCNP